MCIRLTHTTFFWCHPISNVMWKFCITLTILLFEELGCTLIPRTFSVQICNRPIGSVNKRVFSRRKRTQSNNVHGTIIWGAMSAKLKLKSNFEAGLGWHEDLRVLADKHLYTGCQVTKESLNGKNLIYSIHLPWTSSLVGNQIWQ